MNFVVTIKTLDYLSLISYLIDQFLVIVEKTYKKLQLSFNVVYLCFITVIYIICKEFFVKSIFNSF